MQANPCVMLIGVDTLILKQFEHFLKNTKIVSLPLLMDRIAAPFSDAPGVVLVSANNHGVSREVARTLRLRLPHAQIILITTLSDHFDRTDLTASGFMNAFLLPKENELFLDAFSEALVSVAKAGSEKVKTYNVVTLPDLKHGEILNFDLIVFLPSNNKYVKVINAGDEVDSGRLEKINSGKLYVPSDQMQKFYDYSAFRLKKLASSRYIGKNEKKEMLATAVKELLSGLFSEDESTNQSTEEVMKNCNGIVSAYLTTSGDAEWYLRIQEVLNEYRDTYSHSANVSTLAALFAIGLSMGNPEDIALAGLLHDIGKIKLPEDVQIAETENMNAEQLVLYRRHPDLAIDIIKQKKLKISPLVHKAILQHHEAYNGTGFPGRLFGAQICKEAQLVAIADWFDQLTKPKPGKPAMKPAHAVEVLRMELMNDKSKKRFDPILMTSLLSLFPQPRVVV